MPTKVQKLDFYRPAEEIFEIYQDEPMAVFLDSSLYNQNGRYSIIGLHPYLILEETDGICRMNGRKQEEPLEILLQQYLEKYKEKNPFPLPLISGALGYFSYDYGRKFEHISTRHPKKLNIPDALFAFYDTMILEDKETETLYITARGEKSPAGQAVWQIQEQIKNIKAVEKPPRHTQAADYVPDCTKEEYKKSIEKVISYITEGDIYIMNMTRQITIESRKKPYDVYRYLRTYNPSPFGGYFQCGDFQIISASPERFLQVQEGRIQTRPIKGTRKRGAGPQEDAALKKELEQSSKDHSELLMIVDLERNDLNHVCCPGSVQVTEHFAVETYASVFHLVSTIIGKLQENVSYTDIIPAAFPGGSITGAPKIRAMELIDELEHSRRNLYTGSMGYFSLDGNCDLNIIIRTAVHQHGKYYVGAGGGITCESDTEFEYEETLQKAQALLEAMAEDIE